MDLVDSAEKEASEVLHSLLSVERIEKHNHHDEHQVVVVTTSGTDLGGGGGGGYQDHWNGGPVFAKMVAQVNQVLWHGHTVQIDHAGNICQTIQQPQMDQAQMDQAQMEQAQMDQVQMEQAQMDQPQLEQMERMEEGQHYADEAGDEGERVKSPVIEELGLDLPSTSKKPQPRRKEAGTSTPSDPTVLEDNAQQVRARFDRGCDCQEENCFRGLGAEYVYRHRLNIAELTKAEHDMYLMGVTMAVLTNPEETVRRKERRRLRAQYVFQGRRVCLDAFLYLENCTHYQLKRIRKHVMTHGVAPRVHGNHGKKPHNTFPLDIYRQATSFLRNFIDQNSPQLNSPHLHAALLKNKVKGAQRNAPLYLPAEITRKTIHNAYKDYCDQCEPSLKVMGYSTFRHFMKEQFPNVKFCKVESSVNGKALLNGVGELDLAAPKMQLHGALVHLEEGGERSQSIQAHTQVSAIPLVLSQHPADGSLQQAQAQEQTTYIVTPVTQMGTVDGECQAFTQYQLTPAPSNYAVHQGTITMASAQAGTYAFTTL